MIRIPAWASAPYVEDPDPLTGGDWIDTPQKAAYYVAKVIRLAMDDVTSSHWIATDGSNVCVLIAFFGHKSLPWGESEEYPPANMGFWQFPEGPNEDSTDEVLDFVVPDTSAEARRSHPFLKNMTQTSPLRQYMIDFCEALEELREVDGLDTLPNPGNYLWFFDTEAGISGGANDVATRTLWHILYWNSGEIWNTWPVPGTDGWQPPQDYNPYVDSATHGKTFAELSDERDNASPWAHDIFDATHGLH